MNKTYIKSTIQSIEYVDRRDETDYVTIIHGSDNEAKEIENKPFYIYITFINGESESVENHYFATQEQAQQFIRKHII